MPINQCDVLANGPIYELVRGTVTQLRCSASPDPIEWNVLRYRRLTSAYDTYATWQHQNVETIAAQMDFLAETLDAEAFASCPAHVRDIWQAAAGNVGIRDFLSTLGELLRLANSQVEPDFDELPLARWEAHQRYPHLKKLEDWIETGEYKTVEIAVQVAIESEHPFHCEIEVPPYAAEALEALAMWEKYEQFGSRLSSYLSVGTPETLEIVADRAYEHMATHHRPRRTN